MMHKLNSECGRMDVNGKQRIEEVVSIGPFSSEFYIHMIVSHKIISLQICLKFWNLVQKLVKPT